MNGKDSFEDYVVQTTPVPSAYVAFVSAYSSLILLFILYLILCAKDYEQVKPPTEEELDETAESPTRVTQAEERSPHAGQAPESQEQAPSSLQSIIKTNTTPSRKKSGVHHDLPVIEHRVQAQSPLPTTTAGIPQTHGIENLSAVPSAATTSRISRKSNHHKRSDAWVPLRALDLTGMRWNRSKIMARAVTMERSLRQERLSQVSDEAGSIMSRSRGSWASGNPPGPRGMSQLASEVLGRETVEGEAEFYRNRYILHSSRRRSASNISSTSEVSRMPSLSPDAVSPQDAADAHDVGQGLPAADPQRLIAPRCYDYLFSLVEPDFELKRIFLLSAQPTLNALAGPIFRLILVAIISHFIGTDAMVAFVFVSLFLRLTTEEISGAVTDAEASLVQDSLGQGGDAGFFMAGKYQQIAIWAQLILILPVLVLYIVFMENIINWFGLNDNIASLAEYYARLISVDFIVQAVCKAFMLVFHVTDQARFESHIDLGATVFTLIAVSVVLGFSNQPTLRTVASIQIIVGATKAMVKIGFVFRQGLIRPFQAGLFQSRAFMDRHVLRTFGKEVLPLFIGSLVELREWDVFVFFARNLGAAEVAAWGMMGIIWEIFEALTEGICDAAAVRVSFYLSEGCVPKAKWLCKRFIFLVGVNALLVSSVYLMISPNIAVGLTSDPTLQNLIVDTSGMLSLANLAMVFAQMHWSLLGAQNRYAVASLWLLLSRWFCAAPISAICVHIFDFEPKAIVGAISLCYATASFALSISLWRVDWEDLEIHTHGGPSLQAEDSGIDLSSIDPNDDEASWRM